MFLSLSLELNNFCFHLRRRMLLSVKIFFKCSFYIHIIISLTYLLFQILLKRDLILMFFVVSFLLTCLTYTRANGVIHAHLKIICGRKQLIMIHMSRYGRELTKQRNQIHFLRKEIEIFYDSSSLKNSCFVDCHKKK